MKKSGMSKERKKVWTGILMASPILFGTILFFLFPIAICVRYSFTFGAGGMYFVGLENYREVFSSFAFQLALKNTLRFLVIGVSLNIGFSFFVALLLKVNLAGSKAFRHVLLLPMVLPIASVVMVVQVFFTETGIINNWLLQMGVPLVEWLNGPKAFYVLVGLYIWKSFGYNIIILLSGLNTIPEEFYEAASLEGAGTIRKIGYITIPVLMPHFFLAVILSIVNSFKAYRETFLLSGKHPHDSIYMLQHFLNNNFESLNYQRLSVAAILLFFILFLVLSGLYILSNKGKEEAV